MRLLLLYNFFMSRTFQENKDLIKKLEKRADIAFSKMTIDLFYKVGYVRLKRVLIFMKSNELKISNKSICSIYRNEKHLRHMLLPRVESFEITLKNHTLHEVTREINSGSIFEEGKNGNIWIKKKVNNIKKKLNSSLKKVYKNNEFTIDECSIFDWIHRLMLGDLVLLIDGLRPRYKRRIFLKAFNISIDTSKIRKDLNKLRELRNKIAHAEQLFHVKNSYLDTSKGDVQNYAHCLKNNIIDSQLFPIYKRAIKFIDNFLIILDKY